MDLELQDTIILANQLFMAILAVNGIKVVLNTRIGNKNFTEYFKNIPHFTMCASGFLGCKNAKSHLEANSYVNKICYLFPEKLLLYGKKDILVNEQLNNLGINYKYYEDFHTMISKKRRQKHGC